MALPTLRTRTIPQCPNCIKTFIRAVLVDVPAIGNNTVRQQQIRGKQKMAKVNGEVPVQLLKDVPGFGKAGSIVPVQQGRMRNDFFPKYLANYVTPAQLRAMGLLRTELTRDFTFGAKNAAAPLVFEDEILPAEDAEELIDASMFRKRAPEVLHIPPERSMELVEIFIPSRLDFYRQPIIDEVKEPEPERKKPEKKVKALYGAGADLMAARAHVETPAKPAAPTGPQAIYGSVSTQDVLAAMRVAMGTNDESARVLLTEEDVAFVDLPVREGAEADRVKLVGDFAVEIKIKGAENTVRRTVRVHAQEL